MNALAQRIHIGTSGFYYDHWRGPFYPEDLPKSRYFDYYVERFDTVEINSTFYHLPHSKTIAHWAERTDEGFLFALKASRQITHYQKLKDAEHPLYLFLHLIKPLKRKLAAILFQLPPSLSKDTALLASFLKLLPSGYRFAMEFRHESWEDREVLQLLEAYNVAFCLNDFARRTIEPHESAEFTYLRLHGPTGRYGGSYDDETLRGYARMLLEFAHRQKILFVYFNNDAEGNAIKDARRLKRFVEEGG